MPFTMESVALDEVKVVVPQRPSGNRGYFMEVCRQDLFAELGLPATQSGIRCNDPAIGIDWPVKDPILSAKDAPAPSLTEWRAWPEADNFARGGSGAR